MLNTQSDTTTQGKRLDLDILSYHFAAEPSKRNQFFIY